MYVVNALWYVDVVVWDVVVWDVGVVVGGRNRGTVAPLKVKASP